MNELTGRLASQASDGNAVAETAIGTMLNVFHEGPSNEVRTLIDRGHGAETVAEIATRGRDVGGLTCRSLMPADARLIRDDTGIGVIQRAARELFGFGRDTIGADEMGAIIVGTPGPTPFA